MLDSLRDRVCLGERGVRNNLVGGRHRSRAKISGRTEEFIARRSLDFCEISSGIDCTCVCAKSSLKASVVSSLFASLWSRWTTGRSLFRNGCVSTGNWYPRPLPPWFTAITRTLEVWPARLKRRTKCWWHALWDKHVFARFTCGGASGSMLIDC